MSLAASTLIAAVLSVTASEAPVSVPDPVVALVRVPRPWYAPQALVARRMRDTQAQYAALPGLRFKAYSFERETGAFGGVYWWAAPPHRLGSTPRGTPACSASAA